MITTVMDAQGSSSDGVGSLGSRAELMVPWTTELLPQRPSKSAGLVCLSALLWVCPGVWAWEGDSAASDSLVERGTMDMSQGCCGRLVWLLISFLPACRLGVLGLPRGLLYFPLRVPPGEEICLGLGHVWSASGNAEIYYFLPQDFISSRGSRPGRRYLSMSGSQGLRLRAVFSTVLHQGQPLSGLG